MASSSMTPRGSARTSRRTIVAGVFGGLVLAIGYISLPYLPSLEPPRRTLAYAVDVAHGEGRGRTAASGIIVKRVPRNAAVPSGRSFILTCAHVVSGVANNAVRVTWRHQEMVGTIVGTSEEIDLALIQVDRDLPAAPLYFGTVIDGEPETVVGSPFGYGPVVSTGYVSTGVKTPGDGPDTWYLEGTASTHRGGSGGGAFIGRSGRLVLAGIVKWIPVTTIPTEPPFLMTRIPIGTINFAIPMERALPFLKQSGMLD